MADPNPQPQNPSPYKKDPDGNEILAGGKFFSGLLLIGFTLFATIYLVGHWPDQMPDPKSDTKPLYTYHWFDVRLIKQGSCADSCSSWVIDSLRSLKDTTNAKTLLEMIGARKNAGCPCVAGEKNPVVHINTLLLILVALAGFLGNMIHLATSFTTFVGSGKFRRSWALWYFVKPFTAAALAIGMYFIFRTGFLNMTDDGSNINLYGMMTLSLLTGLFTDRATLKLKEVFEVLLKPKEERPDPLLGGLPKVSGINDLLLEAGKAVDIAISGENLDIGKLEIRIGEQPVTTFDRKPDAVTFTYTLPTMLSAKKKIRLSMQFEKLDQPVSYDLAVKQSDAATTSATTEVSTAVMDEILPDDKLTAEDDVVKG